MPTKRTKLDRPRRPLIPAEALELFCELERTPTRLRESDDFKAKDRHLARLLDLESEWFCSVCSVTDRKRSPCHPEGHLARDAFFRVRAVRELLLAATKEQPPAVSR